MKSEYKNGILLVEGSCLVGYIGFYTVKISPSGGLVPRLRRDCDRLQCSRLVLLREETLTLGCKIKRIAIGFQPQ